MIRRRAIEIESLKRLAGMGGKVTPGSLAYTEGSYSTPMTGRGMWRSMSRSMEGRCPGNSGSQRLVTRGAGGDPPSSRYPGRLGPGRVRASGSPSDIIR